MEVTRLFELPYYQAEQFPQSDMLAQKINGQWKTYSTEEVIETLNKVSLAFLASGIKPDDKVAIISNNRPEWNLIDLGLLQTGAINVPIYPTITEREFEFIFNDAEVKIVFVSDEDLYQKVQNIKGNVPTLKEVYTFDMVKGAANWMEFLSKGKADDMSEVVALKSNIKPNDLATIIYTSGTTGNPKGVMLSHHNILSNVEASLPLLPITKDHKALSFLPLNHSFERMLTYTYMLAGVSIYYAESMETIGDNLREIKPNFFSAVPRLLEKVYDKILAKGMEAKGIKRKLFFWALDLGLKYELNRKNGGWYHFKLGLARKIVFSKWRAALGGNVVALVSGSAALQPRLIRVFTAAGLPIMEGYGLTETSPVLTVNRVEEKDRMIGTVGPVIDNVEVKIAEDGEIICKGPNIMLGYYKRKDLTDEVIDKDGWFHTGDIGRFEEGRFLKITDRKKEIFKTSGGKYVAPQPLENKFKEAPLIEQIMVVGEYKKFVSALIVPSFAYLKDWCSQNKIPYTTNEEMIQNPKVLKAYDKILEEINPEFNHVEQIKKFELIPNEWTVDTGELTPTMKCKRKVILAKYANLVDRIYGE